MPQGIAKERPGLVSRPFPLLQANRPWTYPACSCEIKEFFGKMAVCNGQF